MLNVRIEMPSGAQSRGYDRQAEEEALNVFDQVAGQLQMWTNFTADVVLLEDDREVKRVKIANA